jgi:hypothetical protein
MKAAGRDAAGKPVRSSSGVWLDQGEILPNPQADANGIIQVGVVRSAECVPAAVYDITIFNTRGKLLGAFPNYVIPDSSTHTLIVQ